MNIDTLRRMHRNGASPEEMLEAIADSPEELSLEMMDITFRNIQWVLNDIQVSIANKDWTRAMLGVTWLVSLTSPKNGFSPGSLIKQHAETLYGWKMQADLPRDLIKLMQRQAEAAGIPVIPIV